MQIKKFEIEGLLLIKPRIFDDVRGHFFESYHQEKYKETGITCQFVQDNQSFSSKNTLRGIHFQTGARAQAKLVSVVEGRVLDVAVDLRKDSPTFGQHQAIELTGENKWQFFVPRGFGHGFVVLSETAVFQYKCDNFYSPENECGIRFDDPQLNIDWQVDIEHLSLSEKDRQLDYLVDIKERL